MKSYLVLLLAMSTVFLALFGLVEFLDVPLLTDPEAWLTRGKLVAAAVGFALLTADVLLPVPASLVMVVHGAVFGVVLGAALSLAGGVAAAAVGFGLGRWGAGRLERWVPADERRRADLWLRRWGDLAVVASRPVPILAESVAVLAGTSSMGWTRFLLASLAGYVPAVWLYAVTGATAARLDSAALVFGLVLVVAGLFWWLGRRVAVAGTVPLLGLVVLAASFGVLGTTAHAQSTGEPDPAPTFYETATVRERTLDTATASVTVIGREEIEASEARTVAELLPFVPGVGVIRGGTRGGLTTAQIRGGDPNFTLVLVDGVPVNDPMYQVGGVFNFEALPTAGVERIEVVRGPLSAIYGSAGLAGAVHIVTRSGAEDSGPVRGEMEIAADESGKGVSASAGGGTEALRWHLTAVAEEEDDRIAEEDYESLHLQGRLDVSLRGGARLRVAGRAAEWRASDYPDASGGPVFGDGALRRSDHGEASVGAQLRTGRQTWDLAVYRHRLDRTSPAVGLQVPAAEEELHFTRSRLAWSLAQGRESGRWSWAVGASAEHEDAHNESLLRLSPVFGGFVVPGSYDEERTSAGVFGEVSLERGDLLAELGLRVDTFDGAASDGAASEGDASAGSSTQTSPRLGLSYRPGGGDTRWRLSVGRAFKLPSFFALASPPALGGNPELRPEVMEGADAGVEHRFADGRANVGLTLFHTRYDDLVDFDFATFTHINRSRVRARGVELSLDWRPTASLRLAGQVTRQDVEDLDTGDALRQRPDWRGALRIDWSASPRLHLHLEASHVGSFRDEQIPVTDRFEVAAHELWALAATWRLDESWRVALRAENLADEDYETLIGFPGPERSVRLALRYRFGDR